MDTPHTPECFSAHMGLWLMHPDRFRSAASAWLAGDTEIIVAQMRSQSEDDDGPAAAKGDAIVTERGRLMYSVVGGVAIVPIVGQMMKGESSLGGTSTIRVKRSIRLALADPDVDAIMLHIDSPGGTVAGTDDLARTIKQADAQKPVFSHISDMGASAAYWIASQTRFISANHTAEIGSIGTFGILIDDSKRAEDMGIKVHVISTGKFKGGGVPGTPVTEDEIAAAQEIIDDMNRHFLTAVSKGRGIKMKTLRSDIATGKTWLASRAQDLGLIDAIQTSDEAIDAISEQLARSDRKRRAGRARAALGRDILGS